MMYPRQSPTTHTEQLGNEAAVYDWARGQVHALNPIAARVWRQCDGATSPGAIAATLAAELIPEADAVVELTLKDLARLHLLEQPVESRAERPATSRRWLLRRGVAAAMLPAIYSIAAPSPVEAQSPGAPVPPTLTSITPPNGDPGSTIDVALTGTGFGTTVAVSGSGVTPSNVRDIDSTSLRVTFAVAPTATPGPRNVTVTTAGGTSNALTFTVDEPKPNAPTLTNIAPSEGVRGNTVAVTLTGTNFVVGATTVTVAGGSVTVNNIVVGSSTSLTANFVLDPGASPNARTVTVTTSGGTSGPVTFTVLLPVPAPTLTGVSPNQGSQGAMVAVTLTGTNFIVGATTVTLAGGGVTVSNVVVSSTTSLTASFAIEAAAALGARNVTVTTVGGTSGPVSFTVNAPTPPPTLTSISPNQGLRGSTVAVTLTGTNFVVGATTVTVAGGGVTVNNIVVSSTTSLTANFVLDLTGNGARTVTVTTAGGTSGGQTFTITLPPPGSQTFVFTGSPATFAVPAGVVSVTIVAAGAGGAAGSGAGGGLGGRTTATVAVTPGASLTVRVGNAGLAGTSGFNGGGAGSLTGMSGGGGGASSVHDGATALVIAGGGGGGGGRPGATGSTGGGSGGVGGGLTANSGETAPVGGGGGGAGTQTAGGPGGASAIGTGTDGAAGVANFGGNGGTAPVGATGNGGGGGGGGYFGGGGGGGGNPGVAGGGGGGGGSSFAAPGASSVVHQQGVSATGSVTISW